MNLNNNFDDKEGRKFFSKIGFCFLALTFFTIFCQIILNYIVGFLPLSLSSNLNFLTVISAISTYILPIPFFIFLMNHFEKFNIEKKKMGIIKFISCIIVAFALSYIGNIIGLTITELIGNFLNSPIVNPVSELINITDIWTGIIIMVILAPIFEELFFRKILIDRTIKYGGIASIIISTTLFALYHGNFNQFFYAFLLGAFFSLIYVKTGRIEYTITLHAIINFFGSVVSVYLTSLLNSINLANINNLTDAELIANISSYPEMIIILAVSIMVLLMILIGIILILLNYKNINIPEGKVKIKKSTMFLNIGMALFILYYIIQFYFSIRI